MGVAILYDLREDRAVLYETTSGWAFGPVFDDALSTDEEKLPEIATAEDLAEAFLKHAERLGLNPARLHANTLESIYGAWRKAVAAPEEESHA